MSTIKSSTEHLTLNADGAGKDIKFQANGVEKASISSAGAFTSTSIDATKLSGSLPAIDGSALTNLPGGGKVLQVVNYQTGTMATGTTVLPFDDTIPQNTEGTEFMTLAITPTSATSRLKIDVVWMGSHTIINYFTVALFVGTTANALASIPNTQVAYYLFHSNFSHNMVAGVTTELTFKVRAGPEAGGTATFNGQSGARKLGGTAASSITITEYEV
jgi:hypothetical protein